MRVRQVCDKYDLPHTTGSLLVQYGKAWRTIAKLSLPNKYLSDTADDAPETRSEKMFIDIGSARLESVLRAESGNGLLELFAEVVETVRF